MITGAIGGRVALPAILLTLFCLPATAQRVTGMRAGVAAGAAGIDARRFDAEWDVGPMLGIRWSWAGRRSGAVVAMDVQPFLASGIGSAGRYRAAWLLPAYEVRAGAARVRAGLGLGILRFEHEQMDGRTEVVPTSGAGGTIRLPASFALELLWRRTGVVRGFRSNVWSLQLVRLWPL
jgi:hypothetical protein